MAYGTRKFITWILDALHSILGKNKPVSITAPTSRRSFLILSSQSRLGLPNDLFSSDFPTTNDNY
jgi:hypothetical protein